MFKLTLLQNNESTFAVESIHYQRQTSNCCSVSFGSLKLLLSPFSIEAVSICPTVFLQQLQFQSLNQTVELTKFSTPFQNWT